MSAVRHLAHLAHLVRRFAGSWSRRPPAADELNWVGSSLSPSERALWDRLGAADQRHSIVVARRFVEIAEPSPPPAAIAGALLHDVGKLDAGLGVIGRVAATVWGAAVGERRRTVGDGRFARYWRHEPIGAEWCASAGSDPLTIQLVGRSPDAPSTLADALRRADDGV